MILGALLALAVGAAAPDPVAVEVDGLKYTLSDARTAVRVLRSQGAALASEAQLADALTAQLLMVASARQSGLASNPDTRSRLAIERNRALAALFVKTVLAENLKPTDKQLLDFFHRANDSVRMRMLIYATRDEAAAGLKRLQAGATFASEAPRTAVQVTAGPDGKTAAQTRADLDPAVASVAFEAALNTLQGPIALMAGWGIFTITDRTIAGEAAFPGERPRLAEYWSNQAIDAVKAHHLENLKKQEPVWIDEALLASTGSRTTATAAESERIVARIGKEELKYREVLPLIRGLAGGAEGGHMSGATVKKMVIGQYLDDYLIARDATRRGLAADGEVSRELQLVEHRTLAALAVEALLSALPPSAPLEKRQRVLNDRVSSLGKKLPVRVERAVLQSALRDTP